jgi:hypothetical protein
VFSGSNSGKDPRSLFTVAHEISHALLGHKTLRNRSHVKSLVEKAAPSIAVEERDAERLAAAILSPFHLSGFTLQTTAVEIAERFGLSNKAGEIRREEFARMYRRQHRIERELPDFVIDFQEELRKRNRTVARSPLPPVAGLEAARRSSSQTVATAPTYDERPCPNCRNRTLTLLGARFSCNAPGCHFFGDLPDGD